MAKKEKTPENLNKKEKKTKQASSSLALVPVVVNPFKKIPSDNIMNPLKRLAFSLVSKELAKFPITTEGLSGEDRDKNIKIQREIIEYYDKLAFNKLQHKSISDLAIQYKNNIHKSGIDRRATDRRTANNMAQIASSQGTVAAPANTPNAKQSEKRKRTAFNESAGTRATASTQTVDRAVQQKKRKRTAAKQDDGSSAATRPLNHGAKQSKKRTFADANKEAGVDASNQIIKSLKRKAYDLVSKELSKFPITSKGLSSEDRNKNIKKQKEIIEYYDKLSFKELPDIAISDLAIQHKNSIPKRAHIASNKEAGAATDPQTVDQETQQETGLGALYTLATLSRVRTQYRARDKAETAALTNDEAQQFPNNPINMEAFAQPLPPRTPTRSQGNSNHDEHPQSGKNTTHQKGPKPHR